MTSVKIRKLYPGIFRTHKRLADGTKRTYWFHRSTGKRLNMHGEPGSAEFHAAYLDAEQTKTRDTGTIAGLIRAYTASLKFERKAQTTKREYLRILRKIEEKFGTMPTKALASPKVRSVFLDYQENIGRDHPREADNRLTVLSAVFSYAMARGEIPDNPLRGFERLHKATRSEYIWTENEILAFMKNAPEELRNALILALHTGQRYGDLVRLRWTDYDGQRLELRQSKTGASVSVPCTKYLRRMLDQMDRRSPYILTRADGRPWFTERDDKALSKAWRRHAKSVGIERLHFHDLRGTAVTLLSEAGATPQQIAAISGHTMSSVSRILETYLARTRQLGEAAIFAFENAKSTEFANRLQTKVSVAAGSEQKHE